MNATHIIWRALGCPEPCDNDGARISPRTHPAGTVCTHCGDEAPAYHLSDAISDNFTTMRNASRAWPFGGSALCAACVVACRSLALKAGLFFAREDGVWFVPSMPVPNEALAAFRGRAGANNTRPDVLSALLSPPPPPFVACYPRYGVEHGTEANASRIHTPGQSVPRNVLVKCQAKHCAIYAEIAYSRERYVLQVDDAAEVYVDVPRWRALRVVADGLVAELRAAGCGAEDIRTALVTLLPPPRCPVGLLASWRRRTADLEPVHGAPWWALFVSLLLIPELPEKTK